MIRAYKIEGQENIIFMAESGAMYSVLFSRTDSPADSQLCEVKSFQVIDEPHLMEVSVFIDELDDSF